jgi:hypothetical protein
MKASAVPSHPAGKCHGLREIGPGDRRARPARRTDRPDSRMDERMI